jgi:DNA modification methylase
MSSTLPDAFRNKVVYGDAREQLRLLPPSSVDLVITSPPYFRARLYTDDPREIGREEKPHEYINDLADIFEQVKLRLKQTGSLCVNIDDTYDQGPLMIPEAFMLNMVQHGWKLINKFVWYKIDAMSESVPRRFNRKYEMMYWFVKDYDYYYFNPAGTKMAVKQSTVARLEYKFNENKGTAISRMRGMVGDKSDLIDRYLEEGVDCGDLWIIPTNKEKLEHAAPFPEALVARPLIALSPDHGVVLDPFAGSGTTLQAALKLGRQCVGFDLNPNSVREANERIAELAATPYLF